MQDRELDRPTDYELASSFTRLAGQVSTRITRSGDQSIDHRGDRLIIELLGELRQHAAYLLSDESHEKNLPPTALVHEAFIRLANRGDLTSADRYQYFAAASSAMRRILIDRARMRSSLKRGGPALRDPRDVSEIATNGSPELIESFDLAYATLETEAPEMAEIVRFRVFSGLTVEQIAEIVGVSSATVKRRWAWGRAWLARRIRGEGSES